MIIDGEKFACETCIRGHRATQCQHFDRPLQQIGVKGRPVSQCNHCRTLRQSRSVHTKCTCAAAAKSGTVDTTISRRCGCFEGKSCTCAYSQRESNANTPSKASPAPAAAASHSPNPQELNQVGLTPTLSVQHEPSPQQLQSQQPQPQPSDMGSVGTTQNLNQQSGWSYDGNLGAWGTPTVHNTLFDETAAATDLDAMLMADWMQQQAVVGSVGDPLPLTEPLGESWSWAEGPGSSGQNSYDWQGNRGW